MKEHKTRTQIRKEKQLSKESPRMDFTYNPDFLQNIGPIIETFIGVAEPHIKALEASNLPVPKPIRCRFLIDTGAFRTLVKHDIAAAAGLKLISSSTPIHGVGVDTSGKTYLGRVGFAAQSKIDPNVNHISYVDCQIASGSLDSPHFDGLIGRDILRHYRLTYEGKEGLITLRFIKSDNSK